MDRFGWKTYTSGIFYPMFSPTDFYKELKIFYDYYKSNFPDIKYFAFIFKISFDNNDVRSCSTTQVSHINGIQALFI